MDSASTAASARAGVEALLKPRSVAIVGATPRVEALGGRPIVNLRTQGFTGKIYPVNPRYESILGLPCYPDLKSLPEVPDLVLVLVSQDRVFATLDEALEVGARTALVFGGGFAEMAGEGVARQDRLKSYAGRGLRICGPNCNGVFSVVNKTALGFAPTFEFPARQGRIAIISQSGAINTSISSRAMDMGLGFSHLIASGNEADLEAADYVEYLLDDPATEVFVLYIEGFKNPARFLRVAQEALRRGKPIVLMKMGRTPSSQHVALSHTGSMTGSYEVIVGALRQRGVIVVESMDDLCGVASVLASGKRPQGGAMAVVSLSGGMAGIIADVCHERGLPLARFTPETAAAISAQLPGVANLDNPLDVTGQVVNEPECWTACIDALAHDPGVDVLLSVFSITANQIERRFAQDTIALSRRSPVLPVQIWASGSPPHCGFEVLRDAGMTVHTRIDEAVRAIVAWRYYWTTRDARIAAMDVQEARGLLAGSGKPWTSAWTLIEDAGIPVARHAVVRHRDGIAAALASMRMPVALKIESDAISHKTELNALRLNLRSEAEVLQACDEIAATVQRHLGSEVETPMLVQEMAVGRRELILGLKHEPGVGLAVVVGMGGIFSEALRDIAIRVAPLTLLDAEEMLDELRARALLGAMRGLGAVPRALLVDLLMKLSDLAVRQTGRITELDINPLIVRDDGQSVAAVDVLVSHV
ncbi:MAG: acetate--CoA ligase family protein [Rubrivivax sp.]|nr:acetate--CoA ligase family protein [Burkholderiaceae bacterium]MDP2004539.1 acetate--CoA ligase family protein [Rubrivivax sp.]